MDIELLVGIAVLTATLGAAVGILLGRYIWPTSRQSDLSALVGAQAEAAGLGQECAGLRSRLTQLYVEHAAATEELKQASREVARLTERVDNLIREVQEHARRNSLLDAERIEAERQAKESGEVVAQLRERESAFTQKLAQQAQDLAHLQEQLTSEFENIANRILKANAIELSESSSKSVAAILAPLRDRIQEFQKRVEFAYATESREVFSLKEQIKLILETSNAIGSQADDLAKALRGDSQLLGSWGELALERILEASGLSEGRGYISQGRGLSLKNDSGGIQKPDVVVMLADNRSIVIDSKAPLASYERLLSARDKGEKRDRANEFVKDVKGHIDGLSGKCYQDNEKLRAHDCVLMFVPIEGGLAAALMTDPELFLYAWDRHVVLVGPSTLLMTLRTVASIWRYEEQGQNAQEIAKLAGDLCNKVSASLSDLNVVHQKIESALVAHRLAVRRLSTGKGNALSIGEHICSLGVKTKGAMPPMVFEGVPVAAAEAAEEESVHVG